MQHCWELDPKSRSSFSDLVSSLSQSLEAMAGYIDVSAFGQLQVRESALEIEPREIEEQGYHPPRACTSAPPTASEDSERT